MKYENQHAIEQQSFWNLLNSYMIEIPIIQRDYAQGRNDQQSIQVRTDIVNAISDAISQSNSKSLDLGLVYGVVSNQTLILMDGQQRLTTLFLLHWYLARQIISDKNDWAKDMSPIFKNFTYKTRTTARDFCTAIAEKEFTLDSNKKTVSEQIKDTPWFFLSWKKDPTIKGMLVMLDAINDSLKNEINPCIQWEQLKQQNPTITFQFLHMEDFKLTDDLYIKMNARGRKLTEFEKFKAWLELNYSRDTRANFDTSKWEEKLDKEWTDFFWKHRDKGCVEIDEPYLRFWKGIALNCFVAVVSNPEEKVKNVIADIEDDSFLSTKLLDEIFNHNAINDIFLILESLHGCDLNLIEKILGDDIGKRCMVDFFLKDSLSLFKCFVSGGQYLTFAVRVIFYALCRFLIEQKHDPLDDPNALIRWMRVIRNLTLNTAFNLETFIRTIRTVQNLGSVASSDIYSWLEKPGKNAPLVAGFLPYQVEEEKIKASLIRSGNPEWETVLAKAENHPLFRGQIGFLLYQINNDDIEKFKKRWYVANKIFDKDGSIIAIDNFLLMRATLRNCGMIELGWQERISLSNSGSNWKNILKGTQDKQSRTRDKTPEMQLGIIKVIDRLVEVKDYEEYSSTLLKLCEDPIDNNSSTFWVSQIVKNGGVLLKNSNTNKIQKYYDNGVFLFNKENLNDRDILLTQEGDCRNKVIKRLLNNSGNILRLDKRCHVIKIEGQIFYTGHNILIHKNGELELNFEYTKLSIKKVSGTALPIDIDSKDYEKIKTFEDIQTYITARETEDVNHVLSEL